MKTINLNELRTGENKNAPADVLLKQQPDVYDVLWTDISSSSGQWEGIIIPTPKNDCVYPVAFSLKDGVVYIEEQYFGIIQGYKKSKDKDEVYALYSEFYCADDMLEWWDAYYETEDFE